MRRSIAMILTMVFLASGVRAQDDQVHVPVPDGWTAPDEEYRYHRENVWEYINGAADLFLSYGFQELIVRDLEQAERYVTVCVYDMGRPLDAFGVFERERPGSGAAVDAGAAAVIQAPYRGLMLKDRFYVKAEVGGGDVTADALTEVLVAVAAGLPGRNELPPAIASLPEAGRVPGSVGFAGTAFLGLADLSGCVHATYRLADGTEFQRFALRPGAGLLSNRSGRWTVQDHGGQQLWSREIPYSGVVVLLGDAEQMQGVAGIADLDQAIALVAAPGGGARGS